MKLIDWIADGLNRWRKRIENMQYNDGVTWAYSAFYDGGWSLEEVENQSHPFGGGPRNAFERGVLQAVLTIEAQLAAKNLRANQNGEPVDVPFFIHPSNIWSEDAPYQCDEHEGPAFNLEQGKVSRYEPPCQFKTGGLVEEGMGSRPKSGVRGWKQNGFAVRRWSQWTKMRPNA